MVAFRAAAAAILSTTLISLAPNLLLLVFSVDPSKPSTHAYLTLGQALAAGALLGDVFLHALPHSETKIDEAGLWVLFGFILFLIVDVLIRSLSGDNHDHSHKTLKKGDPSDSHPKHTNRSSVYLSLIADALHNFTDGLAIGASFASGGAPLSEPQSFTSLFASRGGLATLSVLLHEIPHELGDFCTLIRAGYSKSQAILAQFVTAVAAFLGTIFALSINDWFSGDQLHLITAGGFVYLSAVTILPEVLEDNHSILNSFAKLMAFLLGILTMYMACFLEEADGHGHHSHSHEHSSSSHEDSTRHHSHHDHEHHHHGHGEL